MLVVTVLLSLLLTLASTKEYSITLDPFDKFNVTWSFEDTTPKSYITFTIECQTTGWVGLGFSPNGAMTGADIITAWVTNDGTANILDMYATGNQAPVKDKSQDVTLISASESNGVTTVKFKRMLDTCDGDNDNVIKSSTTRLIYAYKDTDPVEDLVAGDYHGSVNRGAKSVYLLEPKAEAKEYPNDAVFLDFKVNNYRVPATDTTYYCSFHPAPELPSKNHIVAIETLISEGNEGLLHHIMLYECRGVDKMHLRNNNKTEGVCYTAEMPEYEMACRNIVFGWGVGGGTYYLPDEVGYSIGGPDDPSYYLLEIHYNNPEELDNWVDSSGLRLVYTPTLRPNDVGYLIIGATYPIVVPPHPNGFKHVSYCDSSCTKQWIPKEGILAFNYLLHTHLLGVSLRAEWYRDGKHIGVFASDDSYDFNYQQNRHFDPLKRIMPGDAIALTCTYTDLERTHVTYGGLRSTDEMCVIALSYYPKQDVALCESMPQLKYNLNDSVYSSLSLNASMTRNFFGQPEVNVRVFDEVKVWDEKSVKALQDAYTKEPQYSSCAQNLTGFYAINKQLIRSEDHQPNSKEEMTTPHCDKEVADSSPQLTVSIILFATFLLFACVY